MVQSITQPSGGTAGGVIIGPTYLMYLSSGTWYAKSSASGLATISNANPLTVLNSAITALNTFGGGTVYVQYPGADISIAGSILMKTNVSVVLENNVKFVETSNSQHIIDWAGAIGLHIVNSRLIAQGQATIYGNGSANEYGLNFDYTDSCSAENIEVANIGYHGIVATHVNDQIKLIKPYVHDWAKNAGINSDGIVLTGWSRGLILDPWIDGKNGANTLEGIMINDSSGTGLYNKVLGGTVENIGLEHGVYISVENEVSLIGGMSQNCPNGAGVKLNPASFSRIDWTSKSCATGISMTQTGANCESNDIRIIADTCTTGALLLFYANAYDLQYNKISLICKNSTNGLSAQVNDSAGHHIQFNDISVIANRDTANGIDIYSSANTEFRYNTLRCMVNAGTFGCLWHQATYGRYNDFMGFILGDTAAFRITGVTNDPIRPNKFLGGNLEAYGTATGTGAQQLVAHTLPCAPLANTVELSEYDTGGALAYQSAVPDGTNIKVLATNGKTWRWYARV